MKEKQAVQETFTELSSHYEETINWELGIVWGWSYQGFAEELVKRTEFQENQLVLDIATGTAVIPRRIMELKIPGVHLVGLDLTESMLRQGIRKIPESDFNNTISLTCADAMVLPFPEGAFDVILTGLASHHMNIPLMLLEMKRVLKPGGLLSIIDVSTSAFLELPVIKGIIRVLVLLYFLIQRNPARAWAEAAGVSNVRTPEGWQKEFLEAGFKDIKIIKLSSKYSWVPEPLYIQSKKRQEE